MAILPSLFGTKTGASSADAEAAPTAIARSSADTLQIDSQMPDSAQNLGMAQGSKCAPGRWRALHPGQEGKEIAGKRE